MSDDVGLQEACGVFGCVSAGPLPSTLDVANIICTALVGLQHRGQESAGIVTSDGTKFRTHKGMGLVSQVFSEEHIRNRLKGGNLGIGHTRYSTAGSSDVLNCQPFVVETMHGQIALAHNGELVNAQPVKLRLLQSGTGLSTGSDSELITQLLSRPPPLGEPDGPNWTARLFEVMKETPTAYSLVIMHRDVLYAVRDPFGNRPLCLGRLLPVSTETLKQPGSGVGGASNVEGWVVSSESCSFQSIGAKYWRDLLPGEIVCITSEGVKSMAVVPRPNNAQSAFCIFEYVYFARSDSCFEGQLVYAVRERCGRRLARESPIDADVVSTVPESATPAALGFSAQSGIPYAEVLCKNRYVGRTFIQPSTRLRQLNVSMKFGVLAQNVVGKRIILIDDSIVRGNTMKPIIRLLKDSGAKEVHIRVASPPLKYPCYMGINIPTSEELIANKLQLNELANFLGADSVVYLTLDGLLESVQPPVTYSQPPPMEDSLNHDPIDIHSPVPHSINENGGVTSNGSGDHLSSKVKVDQPPSAVTNDSGSNAGEVLISTGCGKNSKQHGYCTACLSGVYPVPLQW